MNRRTLLQLAAAALGGALSGSWVEGALAGVSPATAPSRDVFPGDTRAKVAVLAEMIIPKTDTPGAIEAGVPHFIDVMVADWYTDAERRIFFDGLAQLDTYCDNRFGAGFMACNEPERVAALQATEHVAQSYRSTAMPSMFGNTIDEHTPFFHKIKELTVLGYYTSEVGAQQELRYNPMPMHYDGDYDFSKVGREWSW